MAANTFTFVRATPHQLIFRWDDQAGPGVLTYADLLAATVSGPLRNVLVSLAGICDTDTKAQAALLEGIGVGDIVSDVQSSTIPLSFTGGRAPPVIGATADGSSNPQITLTSDTASGTGLVYITHRWSPTV